MNVRRLVPIFLGFIMTAVLGWQLTCLEPRPKVRALLWSIDNAHTKLGRPYDHKAYPHAGAPGGPSDAVDDDFVREIVLQWGSRVGKTIWSLWMEQFWAETAPGPMLDVTADEKLSKEDFADQYEMLEHNPRLAGQLRPKHEQKDDCIRLRDCTIYAGWPRSVATLSGKDIRYGRGGEVSKWQHLKTSGEADPEALFDDRFKTYASCYKRIKESTPAVRAACRIERLRLTGTNCKYNVPCPHCRRYQVLRLGDGESPGGIVWERLPNGKHDVDLARRTAHYVCEFCREKILDQHRPVMLRCGVWVPEGCQVNDEEAARITGLATLLDQHDVDGPIGEHLTDRYQWRGWKHASWITGTPARDGTIASFQLSSIYARSLGWGDIAAEFVSKKERPQLLRGFINGWMAETWEIRSKQQTWEQLGQRLIDPEIPREMIPRWASLATVGIDRQAEFYVYVVDAWGPQRRSHTIAYGEAPSLEALLALAILKAFAHQDGGPPVVPSFTLVDSGYKPKGVCEFCRAQIRRRVRIRPSKGSSGALRADYERSILGKNTAMPGMELIMIDTIRTQDWIDDQLHGLKRGDPGSASLFAGSLHEHQAFLEQLLNDAAVIDLDRSNNARESWKRMDENVPNDYRDCRRNAYVAMLLATAGGPIRSREVMLAARSAAAEAPPPAITTPDGRPFLITERT